MNGQILSPKPLGHGADELKPPATPSGFQRRLPVGAEVVPAGGVHFRVWAPKSHRVSVLSSSGTEWDERRAELSELQSEGDGYFSGVMPHAKSGWLYKLKVSSGVFPDPASRFQPAGPHGPSQIIDPAQFEWTDRQWRGVSRSGQVIYEMHIGTFTAQGTWQAAKEQLAELAALGVTVLELMPVADFPGNFGWGYDGVNLYAPTRLYGHPDDFRSFVDHAHGLGLGVILDVVYNHVGPDGNFLKQFSDDYFTDRHKNEWGEALNYDGPHCEPVREFFSANAAYWVEEFHLDGLRLDAVQQIFDASPEHILKLISRQVRAAAPGRSTYLVAENERQTARIGRGYPQGGYGLDALWNDDYHHVARVALVGHNEAYYQDYSGAPQEFISLVKHGYLYQGQWYSWQKQSRGSPALDLHPEQFICYLQNHDQIANSLRGLRMHTLCHPGAYRALTALLLLGPNTPMLFQGQEFNASAPFLFFADHHPELAQLVAKGRREFLCQFPSIAAPENVTTLAAPHAAETFQLCKLDFNERQLHAQAYCLHKELLNLRRADPVFSRAAMLDLDGAVLGPQAFALRFFGPEHQDRLLLVNLGVDFQLRSMAEPLLAPVEGQSWTVKWSSEAVRYGGCGTAAFQTDTVWRLPGHTAVVLEPALMPPSSSPAGAADAPKQ